MSSDVVTVKFENDVAVITIDNPPVNATSNAVRSQLHEAVKAVVASDARVAVIRCAGRTFVAGGDITEFDKPPQEPQLPDVCDQIEACETPFVAAMHGTVLGGGFEIALACDFRIALASTKFGLPEVNIGLIPGAGGTQRLPRLVGVERAADIACSGSMFPAQKMQEMGALDTIVDDLDTGIAEFIKNMPSKPIIISERDAVSPGEDWFADKRKALAKKAKGQQSPLHALDAIEWATSTAFADGLKRERERFMELKGSRESMALRHAFFAERKAAKPEELKDASVRELATIVIVGGGLMGSGIATACLGAGYKVVIIEQNEEAAEAGKARVSGNLEGAVNRGKLSEESMSSQLGNLYATSNYEDAADADLAIEAVFEDGEVKQAVFRQLAAVMRPDAILATNTSYIDPLVIFDGIGNPERCLGLHFFSPAHIMKLVEIVKTPFTGKDILATGFAFAKKLKKVAVLSGICDGFIGNRMLAAYRREADYLLADGAMPHEIDAAMRAFGMPMGPYELQDLTGLQIAWANRKRQAATRDPKERYVTIADHMCELGRFGQRSGKGWYKYEEGSRTPVRDEEVEKLIADYRSDLAITAREFSHEDIQLRLMAAMINEGALIVEEGIASCNSDVDIVKLHGYGFPRWRGGPMHYGEKEGFSVFAEILSAMMKESPDSWRPAKLLTS